MNKERILEGFGLAAVLIVGSILLSRIIMSSIDYSFDLIVRMIPKEVVGVAGAVEAQLMWVQQKILILIFFGFAGWILLIWREIRRP